MGLHITSQRSRAVLQDTIGSTRLKCLNFVNVTLREMQVQSMILTALLSIKNINRIFVDGGFGRNSIYMNLLASFFPSHEVFACHCCTSHSLRNCPLPSPQKWNSKPIPPDLIELKRLYQKYYGIGMTCAYAQCRATRNIMNT